MNDFEKENESVLQAFHAYETACERARDFQTWADIAVKRANEAADRDDDNANELAEMARESLKMADLAIGLENDAWREI